ncbi:hypothetical protein [Saccharopolyspora sp. NPDC050642]|uniref:hypothetical protein n=1 Tax=Saccharopolyspora sp. NPDC050642 TaxID=3157099 RepID=UPI00340DB69D
MLVAADPDLRAYAGLLGDPEALPAKLRAYAAKPKKDLRLANAGISSFMWLNTILPGRVDQLVLTGRYGPETLLGLYELLLRQPRQGDRARQIARVVAELLEVRPDPGSSNSWNPGAWFGRWGGRGLPATGGEKTAAENVDEKTRSDDPDDRDDSDERALLAEESDAASIVSALSDGSDRTDTTSPAEVERDGAGRVREIHLESGDPMTPGKAPGTGRPVDVDAIEPASPLPAGLRPVSEGDLSSPAAGEGLTSPAGVRARSRRMGELTSLEGIVEAADIVPYPPGMPSETVVGARRAQVLLRQVNRLSDEGNRHDSPVFVALSRLVAYEAERVEEAAEGARRERLNWELMEYARDLSIITGTLREGWRIQSRLPGAGPAQPSDANPPQVPFGELKPLTRPVDGWTGAGVGEAGYMRGGPLPDVVDGRPLLDAAELAGVSEEGRAALDAFETATGAPARPRSADVDGHNVLAFLRILDGWGVVDHAVVVRKWKTTWRASRGWSSDPEGMPPRLVEEGTDAWYVMGEYAQGERPSSATRLDDLWDPLTQGQQDQLWDVPPHLVLPPGSWLENSGESVEFFVHVVDPAGVRVEYGLADPGLWLRGREVEWGELFAALKDEGPAELMNMVNPGVRRNHYLAQALGVDEATARVWRMWSYLPEGWHAEALRRAITGSVVSKYGGREAVRSLVETLVPDGHQGRLRALGQLMMRLADRRRLLDSWGEEERDPRDADEYGEELEETVAGLDGGLDREPDIQVEVRDLGGPPQQRAGVQGRRPSPRELNVLRELVHALDGRELDYLTRFFGDDWAIARAIAQSIGVSTENVRERRRGRPGDRAVVLGIVFDTIVAAFGGPERAVALVDRLRELDPLGGVQVPEWASTAAQTVFGLPTVQDWLAWTLGDVVASVAGVPDEEVVRHLGWARAAAVARVDESTAQAWLDGSREPDDFSMQEMREAARLSSSELVRYLGPGRAIEVTDAAEGHVDESYVWQWLAGVSEPYAEQAAKLRQAVLRAIKDGLIPPAPFRLVWSENWIREAERRLAWADATKGGEFPSDARPQWGAVNNVFRRLRAHRAGPDPSLRPESREVIDGLGKSLKASVNYIVVQVLLGNEDAKAMVGGSGIVIPDPGPEAATALLEQIADNLRAAKGMLHSGVLRRVVGGAASKQFQDATGGVVPQLRLTRGPAAVRRFMRQAVGDDVHFLVLRVPPEGSQDAPQAMYVKGNNASAFLASGDFFKNRKAHYFLDAVQGDDRRIDPESTLPSGVMADAGDDLAWWAQHGRLRAFAGDSDGDASAVPASRGEGSQPTAADTAQVAWLDSPSRLAELLDLPESERLDRLGNLAGIAEVAELAGRMEQHLTAMPPGFDQGGEYARNVEAAKRMVRQGAWTSTDLQRVKKRLPGMRAVEEKWRGLARPWRRAAAERELRLWSDQANAGLEELSGQAREDLRGHAREKLRAPLNGSSRAVSVMAYHMMRGVGDGEIARVRDTLARIWVDLMAVSAGAGPDPGKGPGAGRESVEDAGAVPALPGDVRSQPTGDASGDPATDDTVSDPDEAELQQMRDRLSRLRGDDEVPSASRRPDGGVVSAQDGVAASVTDRPQDEGAAVERTVPSRTVPADVSLPPGQTGLSPNWVHLRTEPARFRTEPRPDLASLRNSDHIGKVARARSNITAADDQLTQIYNMVDAPAPEAPPTTVTAADSAETDALLKTATDETTSAAASVERARQQAEKLTAAQQDLTAARQRQDELRAELNAARQNLIQKRGGFLRASRERAQLLRNQHENQGPVPDALLAQRADAEARVETAAAEFTAVRERIEQLTAADQEASERTAEAIARAENERGATAEAAKTATKAVTQARIAADRADVTVRQVDLPPYAADGAMGSGKIWQTGNIDPEDVLTALPEDLREPARAAIEELFSDAKLTRTLRRLADEGIRIEVGSRELHLKFERTASTPVRLPQADGVIEYGIRYADAGLTVGQEQGPQFGMLGVVPNMVGAAAKGAVRNVIFNPSVRPSMGKSEQRSLVSATEFSRGLSSRVPERNFVVDGRFVIDVREGENPPETYRTDEITDVALICYDGEDVPPATTKPGPDDPVLPLPASALHEVFTVPQAAAMRRIRQQVLAKLPLSEVGVGVRDSVSRELAEDKAIVKFEEITGGGYRPSPLRLPGAKLNTLSLEVSAELRSVRRVDSRVVPAVNLGQNAGSDTKFDTSETQSANAEASVMVGPGFVADVDEKRRGLGSYTTITPFTVSSSAGSGESLTQVLGISTGKKSVTNIESDAVLVEATLDVRVERYSTDPMLEGSDTGAEKVFLWMSADDFARLEEISTAHSARQIAEEQDAPHESPTVPDGLRERQNFRDLVERVRPDVPRTLVETSDGRVDARLENETAEQLVLSILADYSKRPEITIPAGEPRQPDMLAAGKSTGGGVVDRAPGIERVLPEVRRMLRDSVGNELASLSHDKRALVETQLSSVFGASALFGLFNGELRDVTKTIRVGDQLVTIKVRPELGALIGTGKVEKATVDFTAKNAIRGEIKAKAGTQQRIGVESGAAIGTKRKDFWRNIGFLFGASAQFSHGYSSTAAQSYKVNRRAKYKGPAVTFDRQVTWSISVSTKATTPETEQPESQTEQTEPAEAQNVQPDPWYRWLGLFRGQANRSDAPNNGDIELTTLSDRSSTSDSDSDSVRSSGDASTSSSATTTGSSTVGGWARVLVPEPLAPTTAQGDLTNLGTVIRDFDYADQDDNPFQVKVEFLMPQGVATPSTVLSEPIEDILHNLAGSKQHDATPDPEDPLAAPLDQLLAPGGLPITGGRVRLRLFDAHPIDTVSDKLSLEVVAEGGLKLDGQETRGMGGEGRFRVPTLMQFGSKSGKRAHVAPSFTGRGTFSQEKGTTYGLGTARRRTGKTRGATHLYRAHAVFEITSYGESDAAAETEQIAVNGGVEFLLADAVAQRLHTNPAREPEAEGQPPQTRHLDLPAGVAAKPKPATEVRYPPEFVLSGAALGPTIVTEISNAHEVAPLIKSMISDHAPGFGTGRWLEVPTGIGGSVETLASSTALGARFGQATTSGTSLLAARPYLGGTETIEFVVRARYAPDAQATPNTEIKSDTFFQNTEKRAQTESRSSGGGLIGSVLVARSFNGKLRRAGAHPDAGYGKEWSRSQRDTDSDAFKRRVAAEDETSYSYTWPTWFQVEMYRSWTPNAVLNNLLLTAPRRGVEMWSAMRDDTRTPEQRRFTSDGTALFTIPGGLTTTTPPAPRPVRISGRPVPVGGAVELGSLPQDLRGMDVIPLALPGSERLFPWLAAALAHTTQQATNDADPASSEPSMQAPAGSGWVRPATLPAQLLWQLGGEEGLTAMTQELLDGPVPFPAMVETGMVWDDEHGLAVRLRFAEVEYVNSFTATGGLTHEQKTEQEVTQTDTSNSSATLPGLAMVQGSDSKAKSGKSGNVAGDMLLPGESSTLDPSGGVSGSRSKPRVQVSTRGNAREVTVEMKGTYHVYRAGKAIYTLTDQTGHRTLFGALPGKPAEVEVTIDNGGYFAVESTQAAANNLPGPPPEPSPPASAPAPAPAALPDVWTPNADDQDAAALLPKVGGHLVVGITASGDNLTVPELAARIEQLPGWARRPIVLVGTDGSLDLADAAQLRDILGVDVIAADQEVWHAADGRVVTGDLSFVRSGLPTWSEWAEARLGGEVRSATAGHWYLLSAAGGMRQLPGADLVSALVSSGSSVQAGTAPRFDFRWGVRSAPVSLPIHGAETAEYSGWTRSPHHAAAVPEGSRPLLVLGHDDTVIPNAEVTELRSTGADVLARVNRGRGPKWMLHRADGSRPRPVEPPTELTRSPRPEPLLFRGPGDSTETIEQAEESAPVLPDDTQIVGVHVTPDGRAVLRDGRKVTPEAFADEVREDRRFVPGAAVALLGCGAHRRLGPGELTFAERFARALHMRVWTARVDVVQTADGLVHATKVSVAEDGKLLPKFVDGLGTGHWYLLGAEGQQLWRSGPELRAAVNGSAPPRYVNGAPPAVIRWTGRQGGPARDKKRQRDGNGREIAGRGSARSIERRNDGELGNG